MAGKPWQVLGAMAGMQAVVTEVLLPVGGATRGFVQQVF